MAVQTPNLKLIKPQHGEYKNSWEIPVNKNWDIIDELLGGVLAELADAQGTEASLTARLAVALNDDGTLKDIPEVAAARQSSVYGYAEGANAFDLNDRVERGDREVFTAREQAANLRDALAAGRNDWVANCVNSAPLGFLSFTGANVKVDGSVTPVVADINGYRQVIRTLKQVTATGGAGDRYVYLQRSATGEVYLDRTGIGQDTGAVGTDAGKLRKFSDTTQNFVTSGVQPGDILEITSISSPNADKYVIASVVDPNNLLIVGLFTTAQSVLNYKITNPLAPSLLLTATAHSKKFQVESGLIYIGRAVWDGANITSVYSYALKGLYEQFSSVSLTLGDFALSIVHELGYMPSELQLFGSQASDYSQALEPLSVAEHSTSGLQRSVIVDMTDTTIRVKNATNGVFYKSYGGVSQTSGFLLVRARR